MKFFTAIEILRSIFLSVIAGTLFGCLYRAAEVILISLRKIVFLLPNAMSAAGSLKSRGISEYINRKRRIKLSPVAKNIFDFFIFLFFGISLILLYYVTLDGIFRIYVLITVSLCFTVAQRFFGKPFAAVFDWVFSKIYFVLFLLLTICTFPIVKAVKFVKKQVTKLIVPIRAKYVNKRSQWLIKRKLMEVKEKLEKI